MYQDVKNAKADALAGLAASIALSENDKVKITVTERKLIPPLGTHQAIADFIQVSKSRALAYENSFRDQREPFIDYILHGILHDNIKDRTTIQRPVLRFYYDLSA